MRLVVAATAIMAIGMLPINLLPVLVESWIQHLGASPSQAGSIATIEIGAMAIASIALSSWVHRLPRRCVCAVAGLAVLLLHLLSAGTSSVSMLIALRGLAGLCEGVLLGTAAATLSGERDPERLYAWVAIAGSLIAISMWAIVPFCVDRWGAEGAFGAMSGLVVAAIPLTFWVPSSATVQGGGAEGSGLVPSNGNLLRSGFMLAMGGVSVAMGQCAVWSFSGRIAESLSFSSAGVGMTFGAATFAGTLGAGLAAWAGLDRGRMLPLLAGSIGILLAIAFITASPTPIRFVLGEIGFALFYFFVSPYVMGLAAELDPRGRVASGLSGALLIGAGLGPIIGGLVVERYSFAVLGLVGALLTLLPGMLLIFDPVLRRSVLRSSTVGPVGGAVEKTDAKGAWPHADSS